MLFLPSLQVVSRNYKDCGPYFKMELLPFVVASRCSLSVDCDHGHGVGNLCNGVLDVSRGFIYNMVVVWAMQPISAITIEPRDSDSEREIR